MSELDDLKTLVRNTDPVICISDSLILEFLSYTNCKPDLEKVRLTHKFIEFVIRMYLVNSVAFNTQRAAELLHFLEEEALGHTRAG